MSAGTALSRSKTAGTTVTGIGMMTASPPTTPTISVFIDEPAPSASSCATEFGPHRSRDYGESWEDAGLPVRVNSTIWWIVTNPADAGLIFCRTIMG